MNLFNYYLNNGQFQQVGLQPLDTMPDLTTRLKYEESKFISGELNKLSLIPLLKEKHYYVQKRSLIGDAPKEFIRAYFFEEHSTVRINNPLSWSIIYCKNSRKMVSS